MFYNNIYSQWSKEIGFLEEIGFLKCKQRGAYLMFLPQVPPQCHIVTNKSIHVGWCFFLLAQKCDDGGQQRWVVS